MKTYRKTAVIVGVLFIIGTATGIIEAVFHAPILAAPDYLTGVAAHESQIAVGAFLIFLMGVACAGIGLALYPIMKKYSAGLAIGVVGFRVMEGLLDILAGVSIMALLALSQDFVSRGAPDAAHFQTIGAIIKAGNEWLSNGAVLFTWGIGALMYYAVFFRYRLVPRWLSVWGLVGIGLTTIGSVLVMLHVIPGFGPVQLALGLPIAPQEMVFAVWLIVKGFNPAALASLSTKTATYES